jgi:hypothetical protein
MTHGVPLLGHFDGPGGILGHDRSTDLVDSFHHVHDLLVNSSRLIGRHIGPFHKLEKTLSCYYPVTPSILTFPLSLTCGS